MAGACTICGAVCDTPAGECAGCVGLLRWVRGYFAHVPGLAEKITPDLRFVEDLGVESLDWMCWPDSAVTLGVAAAIGAAVARLQS